MPAKLNIDDEDGYVSCDLPPDVSEKLVEEFRRKISMSLSMSSSLQGQGGRGDDCQMDRNTTERVAVPSSEHVAEIVGRQGK